MAPRVVLLVAAGMTLAGCGDQVVGGFSGDSTSAATPGSETSDPLGASSSETSTDSSGGTSGGTSGSVRSDETADDTPVPQDEVCDGVDNDLDGLIDEVGPPSEAGGEQARCGDCRLLQSETHAWWVCDEKLDWEAAQARCETFGATSAIVPSAATQTFLAETVGEGWFWLGARQAPDEGVWGWPDGVPLSYANWGETQPDNTAPEQDCVRLTFGIRSDGWFDGAWDDFFCEDSLQVLCSAPHVLP